MRLPLLFFALCLTFASLLAQSPVNDDCDGIVDLGVAPYCPDVTIPENFSEIYTNVDATATDIGFGNNPTCFSGGTAQRDVWFSFTTTDTILDYTITVMGVEGLNGEAPILNPQVALYRGACQFDNLAELFCASAEIGENMVVLDAEGLTPGITYYLRINDYSGSAAPNAGSFKLCVDKQDPINLITDGESTACTGELFDSGGPDGDYENNENNVFTICPSDLNQCIVFSLEYYNLEFGDFAVTDQLLFYDGPTNDQSTLITTLGGYDFANFAESASSGVCYQVQASSGCMTIQFISDGSSTFSGFAGSWECSTTACEVNAPLGVNITPEAAVIEEAITTPAAITTVVNIDCEDVAYATFDGGDNTDLGLSKGLLLTSGNAADAVGPNNSFGGFDGDHGRDGDDDLDALSALSGNPLESRDACVIELDVFANTNELSFEYIFGSEEYPEFVNDNFNDIFAFLISGDGITGIPELNGQENIAVLPGTNTAVEIDAVNHLVNWEYYRNNEDGISLQYDGLTSDFMGAKKSLTARATVTPCETYRLKLAIADRGDGAYDSGVFISELTGGTPQIEFVFNSGIDYLIEQCTDEPDEIIVILENPEDEPVTYGVVISGTATLNEDYLLSMPSELTFLPGSNEITFPIEVLNDLDDMEGTETIIIQLTNDFGCGTVALAEIEIDLEDQFTVDINAGMDTVKICAGSGTQLVAQGAADYFWTPVNIYDDATASNPTATPTESGWIYVEGNIGLNCTASDSIYIQLVDPTISISEETFAICEGESVTITAQNFNDDMGISWLPVEGVSDPTAATVTLTPAVSTQYIVSMDTGLGCFSMDTVFIDVGAFDPPDVIGDTTICQNFGVTLAQFMPPPSPTTTYQWTPEEDFFDPTNPTPTVFPDETTTYQLVSTSNNGACSETQTVTVTVLAADVAISPETVTICQGEEAVLTATTSTGMADNLIWSPDDGTLSSTTGLNVTVNPLENTTYLATFSVGICTVVDSIVVRVDSLPQDMSITAEPFQDPYCQGELVALTSPDYDAPDYPFITHNWVGVGLESFDTLYNMVITTTETFTYQRTTVNGACSRVEEILINVITDDGFMISPVDTFICSGESVQLMASSEQGGEVSWSPSEGLSCDDCLDPVATPTSTTNYTASFDVDGCVIELSSTINVGVEPVIDIIADQTVCPGDMVTLSSGTEQAGVTYSWTAAGDPDFSSNTHALMITANQTETYTLVASNECNPAVTASVTITVADPLPVLGIGSDQTLCVGDIIELSTEVDGTPVGSPNFNWTYDGMDAPGLNAQFTATTTGFAVFTYIYGQNCGSFVDSVLITVNTPPVIDLISDAEYCFGEVPELSLNIAEGEDGVTYSWSSPNDPSIDSADPTIIVSPATTTTYLLEASNECATILDSVTITVVEPLQILNIGDDQTVCLGETFDLAAQVAGTPVDGIDFFQWTYDGIVGNEIEAQFTATTTGFAVFSYMYGQNCGTILDSLLITVEDTPSINLISSDTTSYCLADVPAALLLNLEPAEAGVSYSWSSPEDPAVNSNMAGLMVSPTATTTYILNAANATCSIMDTVVVTVIQPAALTATDFIVFSPQITMADLESAVTGGGGTETFQWTVEGSEIGNTPIIVDFTPDDFNFELPNVAVITYTNDCETLIDSTFLQILDYRMPNVFSPNGDGTNDVFKPFYIGEFDVVELVVFNRWGQEIFSSNDPNNPGWDGTTNGKPAPSDVYIYRVMVGLAGETIEENGQVTLVR